MRVLGTFATFHLMATSLAATAAVVKSTSRKTSKCVKLQTTYTSVPITMNLSLSHQHWIIHSNFIGTITAIICISHCYSYSLDTHIAYTRESILTHNSSEDTDWLKEVPFKQVFFDIFTFWGSFNIVAMTSNTINGMRLIVQICLKLTL